MGGAQSAHGKATYDDDQPVQEDVQTQQHDHTVLDMPPQVFALIASWLGLQDRLTLAKLVLLAPGIDDSSKSRSSDSQHHAARAAAAAAVLDGVRAAKVTLGPGAGPSASFVGQQLRQLRQLTVELTDPRNHQAGSNDLGVGALASLSSSLCSLRLAAPEYWAWQRDAQATTPAVYAAAAAAVQHLTRLTSLELANWELGAASLCRCARQLRRLQHLALTGLAPRLTPAGAADLAAATGGGLAALSSLVLQDCLPAEPIEAARALCALRPLLQPLRSLRLQGIGIAGECGPALAAALTGSSRLEVLELNGARLFPGLTAGLAAATGIRKLSLSCCQPSAADMIVVAAALTGLTSLDISGNTWIEHASGDAVLHQVGMLTRLRHLDCSRIGVVSASGMAAAVRNLQLTSLVAADVNRLTAQCVAGLLAASCKKLQLLDARPVAHIVVSAC